jgi:hypothetical protein
MRRRPPYSGDRQVVQSQQGEFSTAAAVPVVHTTQVKRLGTAPRPTGLRVAGEGGGAHSNGAVGYSQYWLAAEAKALGLD